MIKPYYETELGKLYHGDCLEILPQLTEKVDLVLTDPPYGLGESSLEWKEKGYKRISEAWDERPQTEFLSLMKTVPSILCFCNFNSIESFLNKGVELFFKRNGILVWDKINTMPNITARGYQFSHEFIIWWTTSKNWCWKAPKQKRDILRFTWSEGNCERVHPSQKPYALIADLLGCHSLPLNLILDPFLGSGTTAIACERLRRRWIGIEFNEEYCDIAIKRIKQEQSQLKLAGI